MAEFASSLGAYDASPNVLFDPMAAKLQGQQYQTNALAQQATQQQLGQGEQEMMGRAALGLLNNYPDEASRAQAYPGAVANLQRYGFAKGAPTQYPGQQTLQQISMMGIPSADQYKLQAMRAWANPTAPPSGDGSSQPPAPGAGVAPSGQPITPFVATNLPPGVSTAEDQAVRTVIGEAGGEPTTGQIGVASVIKNRMNQSGGSAQDVVFAQNQFEPWNNSATRAKLEAIDPNSQQYQTILNNVVRPTFAGTVNDPTNGATHFYSPTTQTALGRQAPSWASGATPTVIGNHNFYNLGYRPAQGQTPQSPSQATPFYAGAAPVILGDSIASSGGLGGQGVVGASPRAVLNQITSTTNPVAVQGRDVVLSGGASNNPADVALVEQQVNELKNRGAKSVTVVGVGDNEKLAGVNDQLQQIAQRTGARFVPLGATGPDGVHPANYAALKAAVQPPQGGPQQPQTQRPYQVASNAPVAPPGSATAPAGAPPARPTTAPAVTPSAATPAIPPPQPNGLGPGGGGPQLTPPPAPAPPPAQGAPPQPPPPVRLIAPPPYNPQTGLTALQTQEDAHNRQAVAAGLMSPADYENHKQAQQQANIQAQQAYQTQLQAQQNQQQQQQLEYWKTAHPDAKVTVAGNEIITQDPRTGVEIAPRVPVTPNRVQLTKDAQGNVISVAPGGNAQIVAPADPTAIARTKAAAAQGTATGTEVAKTIPQLAVMGREAATAEGNIDYGINQLHEAVKSGIPTGYFSGALATAAAAAKSLGIDTTALGVDPQAVGNIQAAQKTLAVVGGAILQNVLGSGVITNDKIQAFIHTQPGIETDPNALERILTWARSQFTYEREMAHAGMAEAAAPGNNGMLPLDFTPRYYSQHGFAPVFDPGSGEMQQPDGKQPSREAPAAPPQQAKQPAARYSEGQTATGPNGAKMVYHGGKWGPM